MESLDRQYLMQAIELSRLSAPSDSCYRVGAVVVTADGRRFTGYTHQNDPASHAEEEAIAAATQAGAELDGAAIYSSMEPCTSRRSRPRSCSRLIIDSGFSKVVFAMHEPARFAVCRGESMLAEAGVEVVVMDDLTDEVRRINSHIPGI